MERNKPGSLSGRLTSQALKQCPKRCMSGDSNHGRWMGCTKTGLRDHTIVGIGAGLGDGTGAQGTGVGLAGRMVLVALSLLRRAAQGLAAVAGRLLGCSLTLSLESGRVIEAGAESGAYIDDQHHAQRYSYPAHPHCFSIFPHSSEHESKIPDGFFGVKFSAVLVDPGDMREPLTDFSLYGIV